MDSNLTRSSFVMMATAYRRPVLILTGTAVFVLVSVTVWHLFGHRQVPLLAEANDSQSTAGLDSWPVPYSPVVGTISLKEEHNGIQEIPGLLSINLVVVPFLQYNATDEVILEREKEYKTALQRNLNHNLVSCVHVLTTNAQETLQRFNNLSNQSKLVVSEVESIDLARDPFDYISQNLVGKDVMFSNADIYLGGGFDSVDPLVMSQQKIMYTLTRRVAQEEKCDKTVKGLSGVDMCLDIPYWGSHDVFLFRLIEPLPQVFLKELEFHLASPGMENIVIWLFQKKLKYCTLNPCTILETFHLHCSNVRNRKGKPRVDTRHSGRAPFTKKLVCS